MAQQPIGGIIEVLVDGEAIDISTDEVEVNAGEPMLEMVMGGHGRPIAPVSKPQEAYVSGEMHVVDFQKHRALIRKQDAVVTVRFPHGTFVLQGGIFSSEGAIKSGQSKMPFKFVGKSGEFV